MTAELRGVLWRLAIYFVVASIFTAVLVIVYGQFQFTEGKNYNAEFSNVSGLKSGNPVRIAGVEVGKVNDISINPDATVHVNFSTDPSVILTDGTQAKVRYDNLFGGRYLALDEGVGGLKTLNPGQTIGLGRTEPALDLESVTGGFRPLFRALNPEQVNSLSGELIKAFQGEGGTIGTFLDQAAVATSTLADRDLLIGQVIDNLNVVLGVLGGQSDRLDKAVVSLSQLVQGLAARKTDISNAVAFTDAAAGSLADLLTQARAPFKNVVHQADRVAATALADADYLDNFLNTRPDVYKKLERQGIYGDYFTFFLCDVVLKFNGKGGQPVYVKVAGQSTGRCTPK